MKGATADPWVNTTSPPNIAITSKSGSSQNFLRTRRKCQSSCKNSITHPSEQTLHGVRRRTRGRTHHPSRSPPPRSLDPQRIAMPHPHDQGSRNNAEAENEPHHERSYHVMEQKA